MKGISVILGTFLVYIISCSYVEKLLLSEEGRNSETCYSDINCVDFGFSLTVRFW